MRRRQGKGDYLGGNTEIGAEEVARASYVPIEAPAVFPAPRSAEEQAAFDDFKNNGSGPKYRLIKASDFKGKRGARPKKRPAEAEVASAT